MSGLIVQYCTVQYIQHNTSHSAIFSSFVLRPSSLVPRLPSNIRSSLSLSFPFHHTPFHSIPFQISTEQRFPFAPDRAGPAARFEFIFRVPALRSLSCLGIEVDLSLSLSKKILFGRLKGRSRPAKPFVMEKKKIVGFYPVVVRCVLLSIVYGVVGENSKAKSCLA